MLKLKTMISSHAMCLRPVVSLLLLLCSCFGRDHQQICLEKLYQEREWFRLRKAVQSAKGPAFYRGVIACAFNKPKLAARELQAAIRSSPASAQAYEAHNLLVYIHFRAGRYREAQTHLEKMQSIKPENASDKAGMALLSAVNQHTTAMEAVVRHSTLRCRVGGRIPVAINGRQADYAFDSNASISMISESEANRLGMETHEVGPESPGANDARGAESRFRIAVADRLAIGNTVLTHVLFFVFRDDQQPFQDLPQSERGVLGLQVMLALKTLRWTSDGTVEIAFRSAEKSSCVPNLFLGGADLIAEIDFQKQHFNVLLDTGSEETYLWPAFAARFPAAVDASKERASTRITGLSGSEEIDSVVLPGITLGVGGLDLGLRPARVLLKETYGRWYGARLGADLLGKARVVELDFRSMTLSLSK